MKANADLYLDPRQRADGTHSVKIRVTFNRKRRYYSTGINLKAKKSDDKEEHNELELLMNAKRRTDEQKAIYIKLNFYLTKASKIVDSLEVFTFGLFESMYFESRDVHKSVSYAFDEKIKSLITNRQVSTASTYDSAKRSLESFKKDVSFADIDVNFLKRYERWMLDNGRSVTTIGIYLRNLRALFNSKEIDPKLYPFGDGKYEIPTARNVKKALSLEEIALIYNFEADPNTWIETARDYWIFLYLANGMNVKDFTLLRWKDIKNNTLSYVRAKTKNTRKTQKVITVDLKPQLKEIIQKYGKHSLNQNDYIFPHLTHDMTPERERAVQQQLTQMINKYMKQIGRVLGINKDITTYYARHSFATVMKRSGANVSMISDLLGHQNVATTENYLDGFEDEKLKQATDVLTIGLSKAN